MAGRTAQRLEIKKKLKEKFLRLCLREESQLPESDRETAREIIQSIDRLTQEIDEIENLSTLDFYFRSFLQHSPVLLFVLDSEGTVLFSDGQARANLGCVSSRTGGNSIYEWCKDKPWALEAVRGALQTTKTTVASGFFNSRRYDIHCSPLQTDKGEVNKFLGLVIDVSEQTKSEYLRDQQIAAMAASIDGMAVFDPDQRFSFLNQAHAKIYGYDDPQELIGKKWDVLYEPNELERFHKVIMPAFWSTGHWRGEAVGKKKDGRHFPQEVSLSRVRGGGLVCVVRDISDRKKFERRKNFFTDFNAALSESLDYNETLGRVIGIPVPRFADFCVLSLNQNHAWGPKKAVSSRRGQEKIAERLKEYPFQTPRNSTIFSKIPETEKLLEELRVTSYLIAPLKARGNMLGSLIFLRRGDHDEGAFEPEDREIATVISNRAGLVIENVRLFQATREAVSMRESLLAAVSHDLKNPLTAIAINAEILNRFANAPVIGPQLSRLSRNLRIAVDRMSALIQQLLDLERLRSRRLVLEKAETPLEKLIGEIMTIFLPLSEKQGIRLTSKIDPSIGTLTCDRERLIQALSNLVSNAIKFTRRGGKIHIEVSPSPGEVVFAVSDTGVGLREEELKHLFELYWQAQHSTRHGSGLGLTIAKGIVEAHGGRIWATSQRGVGSTFKFSIPHLKAASKKVG